MVTDTTTTGDADITLRDVVNHMGHMKQELLGKMTEIQKQLSDEIASHKKETRTMGVSLHERMDDLENRMDALDEDLTATIKDTLVIRKHVGIAVGEED